MNIVLINHYAGSPEMGMEFRPYYFAREWAKMGHKVDIIAADFSHLRRKNPDVSEDFQTEVIDGINYHWIKTRTYEGNGASRAITMAQFITKLWLHAGRIIKEMEPDVVICSSTYPLDTFVGQRIRKKSKKKVKLIHEVHDMWPASPIEIGGMSEKHPFIRVMQYAENSFCKKSDIVVSLLPAAKDYFIEHGMKPEKFRFIPNGVVLEEWEDYDKIPNEISEHFKENTRKDLLNLCFFGSLHKTYNLDTLINAIKARKKDDIALTLIGPGHDINELKEMAIGCDLIKFFNPIPKKTIPDLFNYIDASFVGLKSQTLNRFGISMNKLFDSMMGGKAILYMVDAPNNYVKDFECGIFIKGSGIADVIAGVDALVNCNRKDLQKMGLNGHKAAMEYFNYNVLSEKFTEIMGE